MKGPLDVHRALLAAGVQHEIVRVPRALNAADDMPDVLALPAKSCVSVRMYDAGGDLFALAVPAGSVLRPINLARALGVRAVVPAPVHLVNAVTDYTAALVSPICLPATVSLVVDAVLGLAEVLYTPTGDSGTVLKIHSRDLLIHTGAMVAALTVPAALPDDMPLHVEAPARRLAVVPLRVTTPTR
jgi:prolyl-tRNA editing enzyme YbaK/EbsC (Cys-tRNA(Pro) deacylase)